MGKADDKGEPVKTVTIGGKKVEVPIIFVLPEEAGEKEIERYEHPKVHVDSKKFAPLVAAGAVLGAAEGITDKVDELDLPTPEAETIKADSKEEPLEELTDGKLEEVEKLPFPVPREKGDDSTEGKIANIAFGRGEDIPSELISQAEADERDAFERFAMERPKGVKDSIVAPRNREGKQEKPRQKEITVRTAQANKGEDDEEETPYFDLLSDKPKKKKKKEDVSYRALFDKGYGKAQALRRSVEEQKKRGAKTDDELAAEKEKKVPKGQQGMLNYNYLFDKPDIEEKKDYLTDEEGDEIEKSWRKWLENKSLGALGWGKLNRDGTKKKLRRRQPTLDDYPEDDNGDKKDET